MRTRAHAAHALPLPLPTCRRAARRALCARAAGAREEACLTWRCRCAVRRGVTRLLRALYYLPRAGKETAEHARTGNTRTAAPYLPSALAYTAAARSTLPLLTHCAPCHSAVPCRIHTSGNAFCLPVPVPGAQESHLPKHLPAHVPAVCMPCLLLPFPERPAEVCHLLYLIHPSCPHHTCPSDYTMQIPVN